MSGVNGSGKTTLLKMVALNVILAHIGCPVTASNMALTPLSHIYLRMGKIRNTKLINLPINPLGTNDSVEKGQSSFLLELNQLNYIYCKKANNGSVTLCISLIESATRRR